MKPDKALVYARNIGRKIVRLHVDGEYQGEVDPDDWSTLGVDFGEHVLSWSNKDGSFSASTRENIEESPFDWYVGEPPI